MEPGTELAGRYRLEILLGQGETGEAWRGRDLLGHREVAVRVLPPGLPPPGDEPQFRRDAAAAAGLRHPGILAVLGAGQQDGRAFLVTELPPGQVLASLLLEQPAGLQVDQVIAIGTEVAAALAYAHGQGIVHRDLKPASIFVDGTGSVRVCDFGLARYLGAASPAAGEAPAAGTPAYRAPEQWAGEPVTPSVDLYALGCTLYELLTGQVPFQGPGLSVLVHRHLTEIPLPPRDRRPEVPAALSDLVLALLGKAPEERPPSAAAVAAALAQVREPGNQAGPGPVPGPSCPLLACASPAAGAIDVHAVDPDGRIRRAAGRAGPSGLLWDGWADLPPRAAGAVTAVAAGSSKLGVHVTAVIDGVPCVNIGLTEWQELLGTSPLRLPVVDVAVPPAPPGTAGQGGVTTYALDGDGVIWSSRTRMPVSAPATGQFGTGQFTRVASCPWDRADPVLLAASGDAVHCGYWWAGAREFRWRQLPLLPGHRPVTGIACASLAAKRVEAFVLFEDGGIWHSTLRLAQEGTLDWSNWVWLPPPPGPVTAIAACQFGFRDGALTAAAGDGEVHVATYGIEVIRTGLTRWSPWGPVPGPGGQPGGVTAGPGLIGQPGDTRPRRRRARRDR